MKRWEGFKGVASEDPLVPGVWDVGHGSVIRNDDRPVWTREQADKHLREDLSHYARVVEERVIPTLASHEFDALCSLVYNIGTGAFSKSTLLAKLNQCDFAGAAEEFGKWVRAGGRLVPGLVKRRQAERRMFEDGDYSGAP